MEYELVDRSQHERDVQAGRRQRGIFIPDEDGEAPEQDPGVKQMDG